MLLREFCSQNGITYTSLLVYRKRFPPYIYKTHVDYKQLGRNGKEVTISKLMWCIDDDKTDAFLKCWQNFKGSVNTTTINGVRWTNWAKDCFECRCVCENCLHDRDCARIEKYTHKRYMKDSVLKIYSEIGAPPERILE